MSTIRSINSILGDLLPSWGRVGGVDDQAEWIQLLTTHQRWLKTVILARLGEPDAVEDVFQEVALAVLSSGQAVVELKSVAAWLYRVAARQALLHRRKRGRERKLLDRLASSESTEIDPLQWLLADEQRLLVRKALHRLPGRDAEILLLKYSENWSIRKLSEHLGLTESAVEARLHRARKSLRAFLSEVLQDEIPTPRRKPLRSLIPS